jgi:hypothetical protein
MNFLTGMAVRFAGRAAARRFDAAADDVEGTQTRLLQSILERNRDTEYGRRHEFANVRTLADYRRAAPVIRYRDIADSIDRMAAGERGVLTAEAPAMFAQTSGTEGKPKLIPVTPTCSGRVHRDMMRTWLYHSQVDHPRMFSGQVLSLVSAAEEGRTEAGIPFGSTTGVIYRDMPAYVRSSYVVPYEVFTIEDYLAKYFVILLLGMTARVSFVCTANPSSIAKLCEIADEHADKLIAGVHDGVLDPSFDLPQDVARIVAAKLRKDPARARELTQARERRGGHLLPVDFWPDLQLLACWKGGTVSNYIERFPAWFAPDDASKMPPIRDWGYLSSEARCSVPLQDEGAGGVLAVAGNVYEFVPADEVAENPDDPSQWTFLGAHEIEQPDEYNIFLTTTGGLYRYDINDVVRVVDRYRDAPVIEFVRKGGGMTNLTGEKLSVTQVKTAIEETAGKLGTPVAHYRALAMVQESRYELEVQFVDSVDDGKAREFVREVDRRLGEQNVEYQGKRKSLRLGDPVLHLMRDGWHDAIKQKTGKRLFQSKTVLLTTVEEAESKLSREFRQGTIACQDDHGSAHR